jgi:hypothetical protein
MANTLGTLCVIDTVARELSPLQREQLAALAGQVMDQLVLRRQARELTAEVAARRASECALAANEQRWRSVVECVARSEIRHPGCLEPDRVLIVPAEGREEVRHSQGAHGIEVQLTADESVVVRKVLPLLEVDFRAENMFQRRSRCRREIDQGVVHVEEHSPDNHIQR